MSFLVPRFRSKSVTTPPSLSELSQSCPNLLDLDDDLASAANAVASSNSTALTPGPELLSLASSPKGQKSKKNKSLFLLPVKFRRARERKAQTQALKLPIYPINSSQNSSSSSMMAPGLPDGLEPPMNVRPKHTRPTGLGLGLGGLLGNNLKSPKGKQRRRSESCLPSPSSGIKQVHNMLTTVVEHSNLEDDCIDLDSSNYLKSPMGSYGRQMRRGSDSCILSPSRDMEQNRQLSADIEHSNIVDQEDCDIDCDFDSRQSCPDLLKPLVRFAVTNDAPPVSAPPICIVVSSSGDESRRNLFKADPYKKYLGKSLEQVWLIMYDLRMSVSSAAIEWYRTVIQAINFLGHP